MRFKDTQLSVPEIARTLRVDAIVEGSVMREGSRIRVHAQLIRGATDEHFWSEAYDRDLGDVLALESEVAQSIARKVEVTVTGKEQERLTAVRSVSPEVYESYLTGRFALDKSNSGADIEESIGYFEEAIKGDPTFAPAYVGLANAYGGLSTVLFGAPPEKARSKVMSAARKALELDPESAEAHVLLANMQQIQWQWAEAEAEYRRALELNPNDAAAHLGLADWLLCQGRTEEALAWAQRGRELDPLVRFPAPTSDGFCSTPAATTRPYANCAACWRDDRTTQVPFGILDSYSSAKISLRQQSPFWRKRFLFLTVAQALLVCW